ncbi:glycosyltransferase family 4 protein [Pontibacter beigongshangensis]|uniref:glycosyltransferase family 4 protein n=1 Tax=Pontibacter beigongshangensis TaxID=2574733 RepID=UPI00164F00DA|nr:glycosyltransferase family 4 protein [Pontibacter beigongshangensis]
MKVVQLCTSEAIGGLEQVFEKYANWLHTSAHDMLGVVLENSQLQKRLQAKGIPLVAFPSVSKLAVLPNALRLARLMEEQEADILHMHYKKDLTLAVLAKILCRRSIKLIYTRHMHIANSKKDPWHRFFYQKIDVFVTITEQMRQEAVRTIPLPEKAIKRLYTGVKAPQAFQEAACQGLLAEDQAPRPFSIAIFARIEKNKGQHLVLEAAKKLHSKYPALHYYFFGLAGDEAYNQSLLQTVQQENLHAFVHFKGFHKDPPAIMPCFEVVLLPSSNESFGLVLPEAMRAGVAVIGADAGGIKEIIDHEQTGLLFRVGDSGDLAEKIETIYLDPGLRQKLAQKGKEKADRLFNQETHYAELEELYLNLLS